MTKEQLFFIEVIKNFVNRQKTVVPDNIDMTVVNNYAFKHKLGAVFFYQTANSLFKEEYSSTIYFSVNRQNEINTILTQLGERDYFVIKGNEIAKYYPNPLLRSMSDTDIVVKTEDRDEIHNIIVRNGYKALSTFEGREWQYKKNDIEIEVHNQLVFSENINLKVQEVFFNNCWGYVNNHSLDLNFHFLYLLFHLKKHFMNSGVGFRQFLDLSVMIDSVDLDWDWIENKSKEIQLYNFMVTVFAFCKKWFNIKVPIKLIELDKEFFEESTQTIFENGIFGFDNKENFRAKAVNNINKNGKKGIFMEIIIKMFPSYENMCNTPKYSFVEGRKYLLPIAWLLRIITGKKDKGIKMLSKSMADKDDIQKRVQMYSKWGL